METPLLLLPFKPKLDDSFFDDADITKITLAYLGDGDLSTEIQKTLGLGDGQKLADALGLLAPKSLSTDKSDVRLLRNTLQHAENIYKDYGRCAKTPANFATDPSYNMTFAISTLAYRVVAKREKEHPDEFRWNTPVRYHLKVVIHLVFEAFLDQRDDAHNGNLKRTLLGFLDPPRSSRLKRKRRLGLKPNDADGGDSSQENVAGSGPTKKQSPPKCSIDNDCSKSRISVSKKEIKQEIGKNTGEKKTSPYLPQSEQIGMEGTKGVDLDQSPLFVPQDYGEDSDVDWHSLFGTEVDDGDVPDTGEISEVNHSIGRRWGPFQEDLPSDSDVEGLTETHVTLLGTENSSLKAEVASLRAQLFDVKQQLLIKNLQCSRQMRGHQAEAAKQ